jgi:hypothetical protein
MLKGESMSDEHLQKTLSDLLAQREKKAAEFSAELSRMDTAIEAIRALVQPNGQPSLTSGQSLDTFKPQEGSSAVMGRTVQAGDFFGMNQADATQQYLKRLGRAATVDDIVAAIQKGGARLQGKDPKKNLYISLVKRKNVFPLVAPYTFGLWEFYPGAKEKSGAGGHMLGQIKDIMGDGKTHRLSEIIATITQQFGEVKRATIVTAIRRGKEFRKVRRGVYKLVEIK